MATFTAIPEKTQTATAMKRVLDYVMQDKKTLYNGIKLISGQNCVPESAYQEFMATKHQYGKLYLYLLVPLIVPCDVALQFL